MVKITIENILDKISLEIQDYHKSILLSEAIAYRIEEYNSKILKPSLYNSLNGLPFKICLDMDFVGYRLLDFDITNIE